MLSPSSRGEGQAEGQPSQASLVPAEGTGDVWALRNFYAGPDGGTGETGACAARG